MTQAEAEIRAAELGIDPEKLVALTRMLLDVLDGYGASPQTELAALYMLLSTTKTGISMAGGNVDHEAIDAFVEATGPVLS